MPPFYEEIHTSKVFCFARSRRKELPQERNREKEKAIVTLSCVMLSLKKISLTFYPVGVTRTKGLA